MTKPGEVDSPGALSASVQLLPLPPGLYLFSVKAASPTVLQSGGQLRLPAMHVGLGPGVNGSQVEFIAAPSTHGAWLFAKEDALVTRVSQAGATLVLTSVRAPDGEALSIKVERLDRRSEEAEDAQAPRGLAASAAINAPHLKKTDVRHPSMSESAGALAHKITAHIRTRGDMSFASAGWAGCVGSGLWIESFAIQPLERFAVHDIEYKGLTGSGFETPWMSDQTMCGTKGMAVPLVGFAVRLKAENSDAATFDCEYSGYFKSGLTVGPVRNGAPCRSTVANDPLEGIQIRIAPRLQAVGAKAPNPLPRLDLRTVKGPSFGRYRDEHCVPENVGVDPAKSAVPTLNETSARQTARAETVEEPGRKTGAPSLRKSSPARST